MANILLHTLLFPPDATANAYIIADIALELQKHGHRVTIITTTPHYSVLQENLDKQPFTNGDNSWYKKSYFHGMECYHIVVPPEKGDIKKRLITYINFHRRALKLSKNKYIKADVVISQSPPLSIGIVNALIAKKKKAKAVYIVQDLFPDGPITQGKIQNKFIIRVLRAIEKNVYKRNDAIVAISDGIKGHLEQRIPKKNLLRTIPNFVDTDIYHPMPKENPLLRKLGVSGKFIISYVGNIGNAHDLSPILYCAKELQNLDIEFIIAGNGIKKNYYESKAKEENLNNIKFIGYLKREDTPMVNAFSDICLVMLAPHVKGYSFPSKIYTLLGMAKPIIVMCSTECNVAEFVTKTKSGWAVESGRYNEFTVLVKELYNNKELLNQFGSNSLKVIEAGYTKKYVGSMYDELIKELCPMISKKIFNGKALYVDGDTIWVAKGLSFWGINKEGKRITQKYKVGGSVDRLIAAFRFSRQLSRVGIHHLLPLKNGGYLVTLKRKTLTLDNAGNIINTFTGYRGNKPGHRGVCITPDGTVFFGEYTVNINNDNPTSLYRSTDNGMSFQNILTFAKDEVRHIHFIQWDKYENFIWMGTGDKDYECKLMRSTDNGDTWEMVGGGSQLWRAVGVSFTEGALYWGTDAGSVSDPNYIIKMDRKTRQIEKIQEVQGPCHGNAVLADGTVYVSTGVEGGENEKDSYAHIWRSDKTDSFNEIMKLKKDIFPHIVQYGVVRFPLGLDNSNKIIYTTYALVDSPEHVYIMAEDGRVSSKYQDIKVLLIEGGARQVMPMMKSLHKLGCHITTFNSSKLDMGYASRYPDKKVLSYCNASDPAKSLECIRNELIKNKYDIVIPLNDFVAILLAQNKEELSQYTTIAVNDWEVFQYASDKLKTMKVCMENGIHCPKTFTTDENLKNLSDCNLTYPVVVKPRTGYAAVGFRVIYNESDIKNVIEATREKYGPPLLQEFIPQTDLQYKAELFIDKNGAIKSAIVFAKVRWYPIDGGSSTLNVTIDRPDIIETCRKLLETINWRGYADVDLIQDPRDNTAKVMEINPRITGSVKICYAAGVNFSEQILQDYLDEPITEYLNYPEGVYLRYLHTDILWFIKSKDRFKTKPSWFNFRNSTDQIFAIDDPLPFFAYSLQSLGKLRKDKKRRKLSK